MNRAPVVVACAASAELFAGAAGEAARRFPGAPLVAVVHWRAAASVPAGVEMHVATEHRDRPASLVAAVRARRPTATFVVCDGEPGATLLKLLALGFGGERLVVREDGDIYRLPSDPVPLARHLAARSGQALGRVGRTLGALLGVPVLVAGAWRWRRRA